MMSEITCVKRDQSLKIINFYLNSGLNGCLFLTEKLLKLMAAIDFKMDYVVILKLEQKCFMGKFLYSV